MMKLHRTVQINSESLKTIALPVFICLLVVCGCERNSEKNPGITKNLEPSIFATSWATNYFAQSIVGDKIKVKMPETSGSPAGWEPGDAEVAEIQLADLIILNGANYAAWVDKVSLPQSKIINTSIDFADRYIYLEDLEVHQHGPEGEHSHRGFAPQTWLDPELAELQAQKILGTVSSRWPEYKDYFQSNFDQLKSNFKELEATVDRMKSKSHDRPVVSSKANFKYLSQSLGYKDVHLHWPKPHEGESPDDFGDRFENVIVESKQKLDDVEGEVWFLTDESIWQSATESQKKLLEQANFDVIVLDDLDRSSSQSYFERMNDNYSKLAE